MKVFISLKIPRGNMELEKAAALLADAASQAGHEPFVAYREIRQRELVSPAEFMPFVRQEIRSSDLVIVLYDVELRGGLIEAGIAYACEIPIWLLHRLGERVSSSALGCAERVIAYQDLDNLREQLAHAMANL